MSGFYMQYLKGLCQRRGWVDPMYECYGTRAGFTCLVLVNGREYQTDNAYQSDILAQENAAMRAFMVCRNFSVNGGMLARNGIIQGLPTDESGRSKHKSSSRHSSTVSAQHHNRHRRSGHHSSGSSTASYDNCLEEADEPPFESSRPDFDQTLRAASSVDFDYTNLKATQLRQSLDTAAYCGAKQQQRHGEITKRAF